MFAGLGLVNPWAPCSIITAALWPYAGPFLQVQIDLAGLKYVTLLLCFSPSACLCLEITDPRLSLVKAPYDLKFKKIYLEAIPRISAVFAGSFDRLLCHCLRRPLWIWPYMRVLWGEIGVWRASLVPWAEQREFLPKVSLWVSDRSHLSISFICPSSKVSFAFRSLLVPYFPWEKYSVFPVKPRWDLFSVGDVCCLYLRTSYFSR